MTYILGARCKDGVVLIGDRKIGIDEGTDFELEAKIFMDINHIIVGSSGVTGLFDKFRVRVLDFVSETPPPTKMQVFIRKIEDITREINEHYRERLEGETFDVLLGIKLKQTSILQYVHPFGLAETVRKYKAIGHGEPYGSIFLKELWNKDMTMEQTAELGYFIIRHVEELQLDNSVGGTPQIWFIPDPPKRKVSDEERKKYMAHQAESQYVTALEKPTKERIEKYKEILEQLFLV